MYCEEISLVVYEVSFCQERKCNGILKYVEEQGMRTRHDSLNGVGAVAIDGELKMKTWKYGERDSENGIHKER